MIKRFEIQPSGVQFVNGPAPIITPADQWQGLKWAAVGDSITQRNGYQPIVAAELGLIANNQGVSGSQIATDSFRSDAMSSLARINAIPIDSDLVTVYGGINDWGASKPIGNATDTVTTTFSGALNVLAVELKNRFFGKVVLLTSTYGEAHNFASRGWPSRSVNNQGLTTGDYAEAIRLAALRHGLPLVDTHAELGWDASNIATYTNVEPTVQLHPNALGYAAIADVVAAGINRLVPFPAV